MTVNNIPESNDTCFIAEGTVINGDFSTTANVRLDGKILGNVDCNGKIIMGKKGSINGNIRGDKLSIEGFFEGDLYVADTLHLLSTANVTGLFRAGKLIVDEGAVLNGDCQIGPGNGKPAQL
jgi:cytoskeletal protein CcmA (bactofilin family)